MINTMNGSRTMINFATTDSLAGPFGYLWTEHDDAGPVIVGSGWTTDPVELTALVHPSLRVGAARGDGGSKIIDDAVTAYSDGDVTAIDGIAVQMRSGPFIEAAWQALRRTPPGGRVTYTDLAAGAGRPTAIRAAAAACAGNAAALFVPCHRIIRRDGGLGGFRYGLEIKRRLLAHES
jgi:methylated-DNA-[protein]-cysteine S-methyltransferase